MSLPEAYSLPIINPRDAHVESYEWYRLQGLNKEQGLMDSSSNKAGYMCDVSD